MDILEESVSHRGGITMSKSQLEKLKGKCIKLSEKCKLAKDKYDNSTIEYNQAREEYNQARDEYNEFLRSMMIEMDDDEEEPVQILDPQVMEQYKELWKYIPYTPNDTYPKWPEDQKWTPPERWRPPPKIFCSVDIRGIESAWTKI